MRRLLLGLSGLMLAASSGCAVCSSMFDYDYSAHGGRWDRGDRANGRVGSAFQPAEVRQPADGGPELIPSGKPLVDDADSAAEGAGDGADDQPGEASETPLVPPTPDGEKRNDGPAAKPKTNGWLPRMAKMRRHRTPAADPRPRPALATLAPSGPARLRVQGPSPTTLPRIPRPSRKPRRLTKRPMQRRANRTRPRTSAKARTKRPTAASRRRMLPARL